LLAIAKQKNWCATPLTTSNLLVSRSFAQFQLATSITEIHGNWKVTNLE